MSNLSPEQQNRYDIRVENRSPNKYEGSPYTETTVGENGRKQIFTRKAQHHRHDAGDQQEIVQSSFHTPLRHILGTSMEDESPEREVEPSEGPGVSAHKIPGYIASSDGKYQGVVSDPQFLNFL